MTRRALLTLAAAACLAGCRPSDRARNVVLFIGDAGGIPTLHAASVYRYDRPQALFIQQMPHLALMDTSSVDRWVTDSAAGMSAIVTGEKTDNGVISESADAVRGERSGRVLQTILEHAEQRGLSTGVVTNTSIADATPAACYAHSNERRTAGEIFAQLARPRFGDGADVVVGAGRTAVLGATKALGLDIEAELRRRGYTVLDSPSALDSSQARVVALTDDPEFDPAAVLDRAMGILGRNPRGYFLMVEWDTHTSQVERGLQRVLAMDSLVRKAVARGGNDTLVVFTADHSFDLRVRGGKKGDPLLQLAEPAPAPASSQAPAAAKKAVPAAQAAGQPPPARYRNVRVDDGHTGEQVLVGASGPGAERVRGFIQNTDLFRIMMAAYGWASPPPAP